VSFCESKTTVQNNLCYHNWKARNRSEGLILEKKYSAEANGNSRMRKESGRDREEQGEK
jgi:hypothetical protein